jgi:dTDP-4-amino-4,6-dideoxygalactose transaminase
MRTTFLPFALPDLDDSELAQIREVLESGWLTTGPKTRQFEAEFRTYLGASHAVAVNSCTAAMHLALEAVQVGRGDLIITTPYTFAATAEVVRYFNAVPVFVDVDPVTLNLDPEALRERAAALARHGQGRRVKAVMPVHVAGHACEMDAIAQVAREHDLAVIEDAAHAFPARYRGRMIGLPPLAFEGRPPAPPSLVCFSFYATKTLTTGEGGMIVTGDEALARRCRLMSLHGISQDAWKRYAQEGSFYYEIVAPGFKYNLTDVAAGLGLAQLRKAEAMWRRRQEIARRYTAAFAAEPALETPRVRPEVEHAWHLYLLRLNLEALTIDRAQFFEELKKRQIGASVHFIPLHLHPYYRDLFHFRPQDFPVAYREYQRVLSLPIYSKMTDQDADDVMEAVLAIAAGHRA